MIHAIAFGKTLTECRKWFNLSQNDVAQLLGVTNQAVSKWELGNSTPNIVTLWMLSEIFFINIETLLTINKNLNEVLHDEVKNSNYFIKRNQKLGVLNSCLNRSFFFNCNCENIKMKSGKIYQCVYAGSKFNWLTINESNFKATNFTNCKFTKVSIENSSLSTMRFIMNVINCNIKSCVIANCITDNEVFKDCQIQNCKINDSSYNKTLFVNCQFQQTNFENLILASVSFLNCTFNDTIFNSNIYNKCVFTKCCFDKKSYQSLSKKDVKIDNPTIK